MKNNNLWEELRSFITQFSYLIAIFAIIFGFSVEGPIIVILCGLAMLMQMIVMMFNIISEDNRNTILIFIIYFIIFLVQCISIL